MRRISGKNYPTYPIVLKNPPSSKVRYGTRTLYPDVPFSIYWLYLLYYLYYNDNDGEIYKQIKEEESALKDPEELGEYYDMFEIRKIHPKIGKPYLKLTIKWKRLIEFLETEASSTIKKIKNLKETDTYVYDENKKRMRKDLSVIPRPIIDLYEKYIIGNYIMIIGLSGRAESNVIRRLVEVNDAYYNTQRSRFLELLNNLGEIEEIKTIINKLEESVNRIVHISKRTVKKKCPTQKDNLYSEQIFLGFIRMDIRNIARELEKSLTIHGPILNVRRSIEHIIRLLDYYQKVLSECKNFEPGSKEFFGYFSFDKNTRDNLVKTGLSEVSLWELRKLYSVSSEIIHSIPQLPYFSLLEIKLLKHILKWYAEILEKMY